MHFVALLTVSINPRVCSSKLKSYMSEFGSAYPWTIGEYIESCVLVWSYQ